MSKEKVFLLIIFVALNFAVLIRDAAKFLAEKDYSPSFRILLNMLAFIMRYGRQFNFSTPLKEQVDETSPDVTDKPEHPQDQDQCQNSPQHVSSFVAAHGRPLVDLDQNTLEP